MMNEVQPVRDVMRQLVEEYVEAVERLDTLNAAKISSAPPQIRRRRGGPAPLPPGSVLQPAAGAFVAAQLVTCAIVTYSEPMLR